PIWNGGGDGEDRSLAQCYRNSLDLLVKSGLHSIAFPAISTGAYGFPIAAATRIAVTTVFDFLNTQPSIARVIFCCFSASDAEIYRATCDAVGAGQLSTS
ncbi:MAG: macro domain-containing protein, partial [Myxococcota bacterium]